MRILFCSQNPLDPRLGAPKVMIELAEAMSQVGWQCEVVGDREICASIREYSGVARFRRFTEALGSYLERRSAEFDVAEYDQAYLPFPRRRFSKTTLMVARSVLLLHHLERVGIPILNTWRSRLGYIIKGPAHRRAAVRLEIKQANMTFRESDLVNVANGDDRLELMRRGIEERKIIVMPFGLSRERLAQFPAGPLPVPREPLVAFVGTFDARKGGREFPDIVRLVTNELPAAKFRMLGARYRTTEQLLSYFPRELRPHLEVISDYEPGQLPQFLRECSMGVFPSYVEGFPFGLLEMLAASLPVIAYRAPGPPMMLPDAYLAPLGDFRTLSLMILNLLTSSNELEAARQWARRRAEDFLWDDVARRTSQIYAQHLEGLRRSGP